MNPILKYPGAKWRLAPWITDYMPSHESYLEPYFGSGAVYFNKIPSRIETINDIVGYVVHFLKTCREHPEELARAIELTPWSRQEFLSASFLGDNVDDVERARQFVTRCWMTFGARTEGKKSFRCSTGAKKDGGPDNPKLWRRLPEIVYQVADRLKDAQIECRPALRLIKDFNGPEVLIYADPPYLKSTRTLNGNQYRYEMSESDHEELLAALLQHQGPVILSGYANDLYNFILYDWVCVRKNTTAELGARRTECLWLNQACANRLDSIDLEKPALFNLMGGAI
jgi:DNA adenine methylase